MSQWAVERVGVDLTPSLQRAAGLVGRRVAIELDRLQATRHRFTRKRCQPAQRGGHGFAPHASACARCRKQTACA